MKYFWNLIKLTWERFSSVEGSEAAAAIAYYALFSVFPLFLVIILAFSSAFDDPNVKKEIIKFVQPFFPCSEQAIEATMNQIIAAKGTSVLSWGGLFGFSFLLWSASSVFAGLVQNINQAWHSSIPRHFFFERIIAVGMIFILFLLVAVSLFVTDGLNFFLQWLNEKPHTLMQFQSASVKLMLWLIPPIFSFFVLVLMYRLVPNTLVLWSEAAWGALFATLAREITKTGFVWWYLHKGAASFLDLYGGMSALAALMLWFYLYSFIILFGANLSATIALSTRNQRPEELPSEGHPETLSKTPT